MNLKKEILLAQDRNPNPDDLINHFIDFLNYKEHGRLPEKY